LRTLMALEPTAGQEAARTFLDQDDPELRKEAVDMLGTQAAGAAPLVYGEPVKNPETIATAIRIGSPAS